MIKQQQTTRDNRPVFGKVDPAPKRKHHLKVADTTKPQKKVETPCKFQVFVPGIDSYNRSKPCPNEALANGWCSEHQHAYDGMEIGERLGYRSIEIAAAYTIIGQGEKNWEAYFERATGKGLATVMDYLRKRC